MLRIIWLALLLLVSFQIEAKCDFQYLTHNGYGYVCDHQYEAADLIRTLPDGNQPRCHNSVGGEKDNVSYIRTDIELRARSDGGAYYKQFFCFRKDLNEQFDRYYHEVQYRSPAADPPPGWAAGSRNNDSCQAGNNGSNPIHSALGRKFQQEVDMQIGEHLTFERRYSSASLATAPLGNGWTSNVSMSLQEVKIYGVVGAAEMLAKRPNGDVLSFNIASEEPQSLSFGSKLVLKRSIDSSGAQVGWKLYVGGSRVEYYDLQGVWRSLMVDGVVAVTAERDTAGRIARLVDHTGRAIAVAYSDGRISSITDGAQHRVDYQYDSSGRLTGAVYGASSTAPTARTYLYEDSRFPNALTGILDESGVRFASWTYDDSLRGISSSHGGLSSAIDLTRLQYNADGSTTITNPLGGQNTYTFTSSKGVVQLAGSDERWPMCGIEARSKTYDANGYPDVIQAFGGELTDSDYSARGLEIRRSESSPDGTVLRTIETDWHPEFPLPVQTRTLNEQGVLVAANSTHYDAMGRADLLRSTDPQSGSNRDTTYAYCEKADMEAGACPVIGQLIRTTGPRTDVSQVWSNIYYAADDPNCAANGASCAFRKGDLWKEVNPLGQVVEYLSYDGAGRVLAQKDANGVLTSFTYHPRGWLASRRVHGASAADDRLTQIEYWPTGLTKRIVEPDGSSISYRYDSAHRLVEVSDNTGNHVQYVLDNAGNRVAENTRDPGGALKRTLSRLYNTLGELVTQADASANPTDYTYDSNGNATTVTDALGRVSRSDYDPLNRLERSLRDVGGIEAEVQYRYDALDNLIEVTDPKGLKTLYARNAFGEVVTQASPDTGVTAMTYDAAGNMATRTDARGVTATYQHDALNRVTHIGYPDPTLDVAYTYDIAPAVCAANEQFSRGRVGTVIHAGGSTQYCHERFGQLTRKVQTVSGVATTVRYGYTAGGRLATLTYPDGTVADYLRDSLDRINEVGVTRPGQARQVVVTNVTYAPFGPATGWTYGNGRTLQRPVDQDYRTIAVHDPAPGGLSVGYGYDAVGGITELTNGDGTEVLAQYSYDALGRLTQTKDGATGTPIETYEYDATGNRTALRTNSGMQVYTYAPGSHHLAAVGTGTRDYDAAGNTLTIGGQEFVYSDANRMTQVKQGGVVAEEYVYNHRGERVEREPVVTDAEYSIFDEAGQWLANFNSFGQVEQQVIWLDSFPVALITVASSEGNGLAFVQPDHLGTPRTVIDEERNAAVWEWSSKVEAFGNQSPNFDPDSDGAPFALTMRFPGQQYDESSGLHYNYFRSYDASTGRYIESDPIGLQGSISTYGYVDGNPLRWSDPLGLVRWDGTVLASSAARYGAVGAYVFNLTSQCVKGRKAKVLYRAAAGGFGFGVKGMPWINGTASTVSLEDYLPDIYPGNMNGMFFQMGFGVSALGTGAGCYGYQLGSGFTPAMTKWSNMCGFGGAGLDASASMMWGAGEVVSVKWEKCDECEPVDSRF